MVYIICFDKEPLFNIEVGLVPASIDGWYTEIDCIPFVKHIILASQKVDNIEEFADDCGEIGNIRNVLFSKLFNKNSITNIIDAEQRHYEIFVPLVEEKIDEFCVKYNCTKEID